MREKLKKYERLTNKNWFFVGEVVILILLCVIYSMNVGRYADFYPTNGTFQNYNPVRRLLDGQIPYADFQDYLGLGHLYAGSIFTLLFGGSYRGSVIAFCCLTCVSAALLSIVIGKAVFKRREIAIRVTNIVFSYFVIMDVLSTGISARHVRGMILPIICFLLLGAYHCAEKICLRNSWSEKHKEDIMYVGIGILGGFAFAWSNDYGISCWVCMAVMTVWISLSRDRNIVKMFKRIVLELAASAVSLFVTIEIVTLGNFQNWVISTFGTGGYQSWYYNSPSKSYYLYNVDLSPAMLIQAGICIAYMIKIFIEKASIEALRRYGILAFCNMVCFCAVNEYKLLSGGDAKEVALIVLYLTIAYEVISFVMKADRYKIIEKLIFMISMVIPVLWIVSNARKEYIFNASEKEGVYVESLGGNVTTFGEDLMKTNEFLAGNNFFATYASGQEVVSDIYHPSGTDYIIHVLGDSQREDYLEAFHNEDFKYAATIRDTFDTWEYWIQRANWFFYRDLYANWHPVYANKYELYWEKNETNSENVLTDDFTIDIIEVDEITQKIVVQSDSPVNGIADVFIDYSVNKKDDGSEKFIFQRMLKVENTGTMYALDPYYELNFLRAQSKEYIPISVVNGYGEVTLSARPSEGTYLVLNEADCLKIFTCTSDYFEIKGINRSEQGTTQIYIDNTEKVRNALSKVKAVEIQNQKYAVDEILIEDNVVYLNVNAAVKYEENQGNMIKLMY